MNLSFYRTLFVLLLTSMAALVVSSDGIQIETSLNSLNPDNTSENIKQVTDTMLQDISQHFIVVVKPKAMANSSFHSETKRDDLPQASKQLQWALSQSGQLTVFSDETSGEQYLSAVTPYRFTILSDSQIYMLKNLSPEQIAEQTQRRLYTLGDGVRLIPFNDDPLGWFSDFMLERIEAMEPAENPVPPGENAAIEGEASDNNVTDAENFETFTVKIAHLPENLADQEALYQAIQAATSAVTQQYPVDVLFSGMFFFSVDSAQTAKGDIQLIAIGSAIGVLVIMMTVFRSLLPLALALGSIALGIGFGIVVSTWLFGSIHVFTIVFGASLIGIVVDYSLHYFYHFLSSHDTRLTKHKSSLQRAMLMSVLTSLIGYGALAMSELLLLQKVAVFSCSGLLMAWLCVMVMGPLVTKRHIQARQQLLLKVIEGIHYVFARRPVQLKIIGIIAASLATAFVSFSDIAVNDDPRRFFHVSAELMQQEMEISTLTQVYEPGRFFIAQGETKQRVYQILNEFNRVLETQNIDTDSVYNVIDDIPPEQTQQNNYQLQKILYKDGGVLDLFFQRLGLDAAASQPMKLSYKEMQGHTIDFQQLMAQVPSLPPLWQEYQNNIYSFVFIKKNSDLTALLEASELVEGLTYVNTLGSAMEALEAQRVNGSWLLLVSYGLIAGLLIFYYRKASAALLLLIPFCASITTIAILAILNQPITVFHIMSLFLVLGLGMDYIIFAREMTGNHNVTQQAILLSAVTSLLSFGLLAFSSMPIVRAFGSTILIANSINFLAAVSLFNLPLTNREKI